MTKPRSLLSPADTTRQLVERFDARPADLIRFGFTRAGAESALKHHCPISLGPCDWIEIPVPLRAVAEGDEPVESVVSLVPVGDLARDMADHDIYMRDDDLDLRVPLQASYLGYSTEGRVTGPRAIERRWRIGAGAAVAKLLPGLPADLLTQIATIWRGPAALFHLGKADSAIDVELGYAPHRSGGGYQGIAGTRSYLRSTLVSLTSTHGVLKGAPTV